MARTVQVVKIGCAGALRLLLVLFVFVSAAPPEGEEGHGGADDGQ
jgi:hypothetical protein